MGRSPIVVGEAEVFQLRAHGFRYPSDGLRARRNE